ncbi:response regulator [hot springs metagenome]|uniref:Response regulator n=1 Tax=hot springs metagenome TaxID=433727 RepID=A0A5J4KUU0_9ZZZZ
MAKNKVLVVDDMASVRRFIKFGLEKNHPNLEIHEAANGKEAQTMLEAEKYDLILCDWEMPLMSGIELLTWARNHPKLKEIPFIMVTAKNEKEHVIKALQAGVNSYVIKPFTIEGLIQKMAEVNRKFDRRQYERFDLCGEVVLQFRDLVSRGNLLDLSIGGFLCNIHRKSPVPMIFERLLCDIKLDNNHKVSGLEGFVVRIQAAEAFIDSEYIKVAVKLMDLEDKKARELKDLLSSVSQM